MKKRFSHFTLVEILTVVAIIGILAGIGLGVTSYVTNRNREMNTQVTLKMLEMVLDQYKNKYGAYPAVNGKPENNIDSSTSIFKLPAAPSEKDELVALFHDVSYDGDEITGIKGVNTAKINGSIIFLDGWGSPILYVYPGVFNKMKFDLVSVGADKKIGDGQLTAFSVDTTKQEIKIPVLGTRSSGTYKGHAGAGDDYSNFKR